jgi:hypothetical protein
VGWIAAEPRTPAGSGRLEPLIECALPLEEPVPAPRKPRTPKPGKGKKTETAADVGYEAQLWAMADALRGSMDAAEYKHVALGLISTPASPAR